MTLLSPASRRPLRPDTPHSLSDGAGERWPVVDGIPYLRTNREHLVATALDHLDNACPDSARKTLLADQDSWWTGPPPSPQALDDLIARRHTLTLREAMDRLAFGRVADYFAHRWSDPTYLAGLALLEAHWAEPKTAFELACGIGHYGAELTARRIAYTGADVVFAKLWLARHWVCPGATFVTFDAAAPWPIAATHDLAFCHDALYFLEPKRHVADSLKVSTLGTLAVAHVHNRDWPNLSSGAAMTAAELAALFPEATFYDDAELTRALAEARAPTPADPEALTQAEAFALSSGPVRTPRPLTGGLALPAPGTPLHRNPLYNGEGIHWPSDRYAAEYAPRATYPPRTRAPATAPFTPALADLARRRELVALPERW